MKSVHILSVICLLIGGSAIYGQNNPPAATSATPAAASSAAAITPASTPIELARAAFAAQGGEKFKNLDNMILKGSVDIQSPMITQSIPGQFLWVTSHERVRIEVDARPIIAFKQIYDGERSYSSMPGLKIGSASKSYGLPLLSRFEEPGYKVEALPDQKKLRGFRIVDAEGHATDFFIDPANGRVVSYRFKNQQVTFSTEHDKLDIVNGVLVPYKFTQKMQTAQGTFYLAFKIKEAKVNEVLPADAFAIPSGK
jgi:hypothetical protein